MLFTWARDLKSLSCHSGIGTLHVLEYRKFLSPVTLKPGYNIMGQDFNSRERNLFKVL